MREMLTCKNQVVRHEQFLRQTSLQNGQNREHLARHYISTWRALKGSLSGAGAFSAPLPREISKTTLDRDKR